MSNGVGGKALRGSGSSGLSLSRRALLRAAVTAGTLGAATRGMAQNAAEPAEPAIPQQTDFAPGMVAAGSGRRTVRRLRLGYMTDAGSPVEAGVGFLTERLNGQYGMQLHSQALRGSGWGDTQAVLHALQGGSLDIGLVETGVLSQLYSGMAVWDMPYLFDSVQQAQQLLDGEVGQSVLRALEPLGLKGLAYWEGGFLVTGSSVRALRRPEDAAGLHVAVPENSQALKAVCAALKARAVLIPPSLSARQVRADSNTGLQRRDSGTRYAQAIQRSGADTQMSPVDWMVRRRLHLTQRFVSMLHQQYIALVLLVRMPVWQALDDDQRAQLSLLGAFARDYQRQQAYRSRALALLQLSQAGCTVSTLDRMQLRRFAARLEAVSAEVVRRCGSKLWLQLYQAREQLGAVG